LAERALNPFFQLLRSFEVKRFCFKALANHLAVTVILRTGRAALQMFFDLEELSYKQIAEVIKASLGTVMSRLARARERLKRILYSRLKEKP